MIDILGIQEIAVLAGVEPGTVRSYLARNRFPKPTGRVSGTPYWTRTVVNDWLLERQERQRQQKVVA